MKNKSRVCRGNGGDIPSMGNKKNASFMTSIFKLPSEKPSYRASGGNVSAMDMAEGKASGIRKGGVSGSPAYRLSVGNDEASRGGANSKDLALGMAAAQRKLAKGGRAVNMDMGFEKKGERLRKSQERNEILGSPHYAGGGKVHNDMKALYHALHSHFQDEPHMKKLRATKESVYEGEPHRYKRAGGGKLWIQDAIKPSKKGALHKSLGVPQGKKIPMSKIEKAEHSKSPLIRKRATLARTLRKFHP